mgnify:CR=1 FL=1
MLYGTLLGIVASVAAVPMFNSGMWDAALVDLAMAFILIFLMLKNTFANPKHDTSLKEKIFAWGLLIAADILVLLPTHNFAGGIISAFALTILICALVLYFSGSLMATVTIVPALWCCVFMPFHEELMLLLSYPLRLTATLLSAVVLDLSGMEIHGQHPVSAGSGEHIGHQLGGDGIAALGLAVLTGVAEVGDDGGDAAGAGALEGVQQEAEFHQGLVGGSAGRLDDEDVMTAHAVADLNAQFTIAESGAQGGGKSAAEVVTDVHGQLRVGRTSNDLEVAVHKKPS